MHGQLVTMHFSLPSHSVPAAVFRLPAGTDVVVQPDVGGPSGRPGLQDPYRPLAGAIQRQNIPAPGAALCFRFRFQGDGPAGIGQKRQRQQHAEQTAGTSSHRPMASAYAHGRAGESQRHSIVV